jgi:hypothetical protein
MVWEVPDFVHFVDMHTPALLQQHMDNTCKFAGSAVQVLRKPAYCHAQYSSTSMLYLQQVRCSQEAVIVLL